MKSVQKLHIPGKKIAIASSFEGVLNNGATECAFVSINAFRRMTQKGDLPALKAIYRNVFSVEEFNGELRDLLHVKAFLALRPLVAVAGDYFNVMQASGSNLHLVKNKINKAFIEAASREFNVLKERTAVEREIFEKEFYSVRKETQDKDYTAWLSLQEPFEGTIEQLRMLNSLKRAQGKNYSGFLLYYVTSKDEASTYQLCNVYGELNLFKNGEIGGVKFNPDVDYAKWFESLKTCLISEDRIIGKNKVEGADKAKQMIMVAEQENIPRNQVFRLQDRYDEKEIAGLKSAGFEHHLIVEGGYAFPSDYEKARKAGIPVIKRNKMAKSLSEYAKEKGF